MEGRGKLIFVETSFSGCDSNCRYVQSSSGTSINVLKTNMLLWCRTIYIFWMTSIILCFFRLNWSLQKWCVFSSFSKISTPERKRQTRIIYYTVFEIFKFLYFLITNVFGAQAHNNVLDSLSLLSNTVLCRVLWRLAHWQSEVGKVVQRNIYQQQKLRSP